MLVTVIGVLMLSVSSLFTPVLAESVTRNVKLTSPETVGVPLRTPPAERLIPEIGTPEMMVHVNGENPPVATSVWLYAEFCTPVARLLVVMLSAGAAATVMESALEAVKFSASVTVTVNAAVPVPLGMPVMAPVLLSKLRPVGKDPAKVQVKFWLVPPAATTVWL